MSDIIDIGRIKKIQREFAAERDWDQFHTLKNLAASISIESNELLEIFQWLRDDEASDIMKDKSKSEKIKNEIADVFYYLVRFADIAGIDIEKAFDQKMKENAAKYPADLSRGNAKKYDELSEKS